MASQLPVKFTEGGLPNYSEVALPRFKLATIPHW